MRQIVWILVQAEFIHTNIGSHLHAVDGVRQTAGFVDELRVFHVLRDSLEKAQRLVELNRHRYFGQFLHEEKKKTHPTNETAAETQTHAENVKVSLHLRTCIIRHIT